MAWYPLSFLNEVVELLPLFTTVKTAAEVPMYVCIYVCVFLVLYAYVCAPMHGRFQ